MVAIQVTTGFHVCKVCYRDISQPWWGWEITRIYQDGEEGRFRVYHRELQGLRVYMVYCIQVPHTCLCNSVALQHSSTDRLNNSSPTMRWRCSMDRRNHPGCIPSFIDQCGTGYSVLSKTKSWLLTLFGILNANISELDRLGYATWMNLTLLIVCGLFR